MALRIGERRLRQGLVAVAALVALAGGTLAVLGDKYPNWGTNASIETRADYWARSTAIARDHALTGTGLGTFQQIYRSYEDPAIADRWFVNHAHSDYVEIAVEGGVPALVLVGLFLIWWGNRAWAAWLAYQGSVEEKAASIASAAILLHSAIDYPLRTAAIASVMAICIALMAGARGSPGRRTAAEKQARHAKL
jgi:O-antigen ligase